MVAVGWMAGGLAQVAIVLSTLMGGVSGSAVADAAMEARILGPAMIENGYGKGFSAAAIAVGSLITATIPPSIGLILYGYVGNVSIGRLFLAGIIPGLLMMVVLMADDLSHRQAARLCGRRTSEKPTVAALALRDLGRQMGAAVPGRAGARHPRRRVHAIGGRRLRRGLRLRDRLPRPSRADLEKVWRAFAHASSDVGLIMLIILMSGMVGFATIYLQVPQRSRRLDAGGHHRSPT